MQVLIEFSDGSFIEFLPKQPRDYSDRPAFAGRGGSIALRGTTAFAAPAEGRMVKAILRWHEAAWGVDVVFAGFRPIEDFIAMAESLPA